MIEIKDNKLIIDEVVKDLKDINIINSKNNSISFSNNMLERIKNFPYSIQTLHTELTNAGLENFWLINNTIINLNNVKRAYIKYYQYAGLSIIETTKSNAEACFVNLECKGGKTETISFTSEKDAENFYRELEFKLIELKNTEVIKK